MSITTNSQSPRHEQDSVESVYESDMDTSIDFDEASGIATFPSGVRYSVHGLDQGTREAVVEALSTSSKLFVRACSPRKKSYVFLVSETIEYHVRTPYDGDSYGPSCSCRQDEQSSGLQQHPCRHTLWLCDQLLSQLVPLPSNPYTWQIDGHTVEQGNVCDLISNMEVDVLADSLRCDVMAGEPVNPRPRRIQTAREVLATLTGTSHEEFRPDLTGDNIENRVVEKSDLEATIFRMLLRNDSLLSYFLASLRHEEHLNPRFRRFRDRARTALDSFDAYIEASDSERETLARGPQWCYDTVKDISEQIKSIIIYSARDLDVFDRRAAADTLVYILDQVISRNEDHEATVDHDNNNEGRGKGQSNHTKKINLCQALIKQSRHNFVLDVLELDLESVGHLLPDLIRIEHAAANTNIPRPYLNKLRDLISHLRGKNPRSGSEPAEKSRKRTSQDGDRYPKRVK